MKLRQDNTKKMQAQLDRWSVRLDELLDDAELRATTIAYRQRIHGVRQKHDVARAKLEALDGATGGAWELARPEIADAWRDLATAFRVLRQ
jgi:hypothetical protein